VPRYVRILERELEPVVQNTRDLGEQEVLVLVEERRPIGEHRPPNQTPHEVLVLRMDSKDAVRQGEERSAVRHQARVHVRGR
jgi:hypothetical protein